MKYYPQINPLLFSSLSIVCFWGIFKFFIRIPTSMYLFFKGFASLNKEFLIGYLRYNHFSMEIQLLQD